MELIITVKELKDHDMFQYWLETNNASESDYRDSSEVNVSENQMKEMGIVVSWIDEKLLNNPS